MVHTSSNGLLDNMDSKVQVLSLSSLCKDYGKKLLKSEEGYKLEKR